MGGLGSGRRATFCAKDTTEDSLPLDIRRLHRSGVLTPGRSFSWQWTVNDQVRASIRVRVAAWQVELIYSYTPNGGPAEMVRQAVMLETTPCTLGGSRQWFCCSTCGRRVAVLYGRGRLFACRRCKGLAYASQSEAGDDRATRRAGRIREQLGWQAGILNGPGGKPKGMQWRTFSRLVAEHETWVALALAGTATRLGFIDRMLGDVRDRFPSSS